MVAGVGFYKPNTLLDAQPVSKHRFEAPQTPTMEDHQLASLFLHLPPESWRNRHHLFTPALWCQYRFSQHVHTNITKLEDVLQHPGIDVDTFNHRSTQPCIPQGSLIKHLLRLGVKVGGR